MGFSETQTCISQETGTKLHGCVRCEFEFRSVIGINVVTLPVPIKSGGANLLQLGHETW